ncbi:NPCBM/NEW2 domain-containing protein, partial [Clostridium perfringens]
RNSKEIKLVVDVADNGNTWDHADWANAKFRKAQDIENKAAKDLKDAKGNAKITLENKAETAKNAIDGLHGVDQTVKDQAKAEVQKALEAGNAAIDGFTSPSDVTTALENAKNSVDTIYGGIDKTSEDNNNSFLPKVSIHNSLPRTGGVFNSSILSLLGAVLAGIGAILFKKKK